MPFSEKVRIACLVASARHCCVCHKHKGLKIEVHHIITEANGGPNTEDNAIALCLDCHADAGYYFAGHPKGTRVSPTELKKAKKEWYAIVKSGKVHVPTTLLQIIRLDLPKEIHLNSLAEIHSIEAFFQSVENSLHHEFRGILSDLLRELARNEFEKGSATSCTVFIDDDEIILSSDGTDFNPESLLRPGTTPTTGGAFTLLGFKEHFSYLCDLEHSYDKGTLQNRFRFAFKTELPAVTPRDKCLVIITGRRLVQMPPRECKIVTIRSMSDRMIISDLRNPLQTLVETTPEDVELVIEVKKADYRINFFLESFPRIKIKYTD